MAAIGRDIANALAYIHGADVVHRDVKPSNILLTPDRRAVLGDFGVARLLESTRATQTGMVVGTAHYLSPEQAAGQTVTAATDIYSLGLVLLEALTDSPAFDGSHVETTVARRTATRTSPRHCPTAALIAGPTLLGDNPGESPRTTTTTTVATTAAPTTTAATFNRHANAASSSNSRPWATRSPSNPPPDQHRHVGATPRTQTRRSAAAHRVIHISERDVDPGVASSHRRTPSTIHSDAGHVDYAGDVASVARTRAVGAED